MLIKKFKFLWCFLFIFHDQALIPFKYISKFNGVNYTGNLSVIRTSPDHGTAYDLKGKNNISTKSLENCFRLINKIHINRQKYDKSKNHLVKILLMIKIYVKQLLMKLIFLMKIF